MSEVKIPYNAGEEDHVKGRKNKVLLDEQRWQNDVRWVMSTPQGRRFWWKLLARSGWCRMSFNPGNPHFTDFNEGARNVGQQFFNDVEQACPEQYLVAMKEANEKQKEEEANG